MSEIATLIIKYLGWSFASVLLIALVIVFVNADKVLIWSSNFTRLFNWIGTPVKKATISNKIRGVVLLATKRLSKENKRILPYDLKIEWATNESRDTFIENNRIIIRMNNSGNSMRNNVIAIFEYVKNGLVPLARPYMSKSVCYATDLVMTRKLIAMSCKESLNIFGNEILSEAIKDSEINRLFDKLSNMDQKGILVPIFLNKLSKLGAKIYSIVPNDEIQKEIYNFTLYLIDIAEREKGEFTKLTFNGNYIKLSLILAIKQNTMLNIQNNIYRAISSIESGIDTVYILAIGKKQEMANMIAQGIEHEFESFECVNYCKYKHRFPDGETKNAVCIEMSTNEIHEPK